MSTKKDEQRGGYVSRGALKLEHALDHWQIDVSGFVCADLGCSTGGFTQVLLKRGAAKIFAVDTAYGQLDWKLRNDPRVVVMERTNLNDAQFPEPFDLCVIDAGWTPQTQAVGKALENLKPDGQVVTLIKPHYEAKHYGIKFKGGALTDTEAEQVRDAVIADLKTRFPISISEPIDSPIAGGKGGNKEYFVLISKHFS